MVTLRYKFDGEDFDYDVDRFEIEKRLYEYLRDEWTQEELIEYIIDNDGATLDYVVDFLEEIHNMFEDEAEECWYDSKHSDNGVDDEDFI